MANPVSGGSSDPEMSLTDKQLAVLKSACVISTINRDDVPVILNNQKHTAMTDLRSIWITFQLIPKNLRKYEDVVFQLFKGQVLHEAGHIKYTTELNSKWKEWEKKLYNCPLAHLIDNIIEDSRINYRMVEEYKLGIGANLADLMAVMREAWLFTARKKLQESKDEIDAAGGKPVDKEDVNVYIMYKGIYSADDGINKLIDDFYPNFPAEWRADMEEGAKIIRSARWLRQWQTQVRIAANNLFRIMTKYAPEGKEGGGQAGGGYGEEGAGSFDRMPTKGEMDDQYGRPIEGAGFDPEKWPAPYGEMEVETSPEAEKEAAGEEEGEEEEGAPAAGEGMGKAKGKGVGAGTGEDIDYPPPDEPEYKRRRDRLANIIERMKNMLKSQASPKYERVQWTRQGRMMQGPLAGSFVQARKRPVTNIYQYNIMRYEKAQTTLALLVDLSGSTNEEDMKNTLTIISEVAGSWLPDESWGIFAFGGRFQKIKTFWESYDKVKYRIGGLEDLGGTHISTPLAKIKVMFKKVRDKPGNKVIIIVSDYWFEDGDARRAKEILKAMKKESDVDAVHIVNSYAMEKALQDVLKVSKTNIVPMPNINDLPENFFKVYKKLSYSPVVSTLRRV